VSRKTGEREKKLILVFMSLSVEVRYLGKKEQKKRIIK
jgi:hypothetical protein